MLRIGITYNPGQELFYSGLNQTATLLAELFKELGMNVVLVNLKNTDEEWWDTVPKMDGVIFTKLYETKDLDYLIDIDGFVNNTSRKSVAKNSIVFLRTFLQFTEMDNSVYPERVYKPRSFDGVSEIWCWDILNPLETLDSIQTLFPCPVRTVPFIWSPTFISQYDTNLFKYNPEKPLIIHIAEKNDSNSSSSVIPLVAIRELVNNKDFNASYQCHNMEHIIENKFLKENILNNIESDTLPIQFVDKEPFYNWLSNENCIMLTHSRFTLLRIGLINAIWLGIPVIHNSPVLNDLHSELEKMFYFGNSISGISECLSKFVRNDINDFLNVRKSIQNAIIGKWSIQNNLEAWRGISASLKPLTKSLTKSLTDPIIPKTPITIAFSDMWPGFNYDSNFIIDALRQKSDIIVGQEYNSNSIPIPNLIIFGPYSNKWKDIPNTIPKVFFSAENWNTPTDDSIALFLTSSRNEDSKHMRIPTWMTFIDWYSDSTTLPDNLEDNPIRIPLHFATTPHSVPFNKRDSFCGFVVSNPVCSFRNETFKAVNSYKKVNSGGALYNNCEQLSLKYPGGGCGDISKHHFFSNHKFSISFENSQAPGYITEKVLHAKMAGCIPIYWGDNQTDTDFTPNSFINMSNVSDSDKIVDIIKLLESNINACQHYASTPILDKAKTQNALNIINNMATKLLDLATINNKLPTKIDKIYIINLDTRQDRLDNLYEEEPYLKDISARISAVNGKTLKMNSIIYELFKKNTFQWKKSAIGCNLSHMHIWLSIMNDPGNYFLVLEDDVRFNKGWLNDWNKYAENIPEDAELLYLGGVLPPNKHVLEQCLEKVNNNWSEIKPNILFSGTPLPIFHFCTYSYIITRKGVEKILQYLRNSEIKSFTVVDHLLGSPQINLKKYVATPLLTICFQEHDPLYINSEFNALDRKDTFDSDIWNNTECFTEEELTPFHNLISENKKNDINKLNMYYINENEGNPYNLYEEMWIKDVFTSEIVLNPLNLERIVPNNSWFIVQRPHLDIFSQYFNFLKTHNIKFKVLHLSDEFGKDNIDFYSLPNCTSVIRNYVLHDIPILPHIITIPLGYHYKASNTSNTSNTFADRKLVWSFHGNSWFDRKLQLENLYSFLPHNCHFINEWNAANMTKQEQYLSTLGNSKFCPIIRGNNIETFRLYEALESGTIPIYVRQEGDELFWKMISSNLKMIELKTWAIAQKMVQHFLDNPGDGEKYKMKLVEAWTQWKIKITVACNSLIKNS